MIVPITPALCAEAGRVWAESWRAAYADAADPAYVRRQTAAAYARRVLAPHVEAYAFLEEDAVAGVLRLDTATGELATLYVAPARQGRGIGGRLLRFGVARLRALGLRPWLGVLSANRRAAAIYARCGFVPTGEELTLDAARDLREVRYRWRGGGREIEMDAPAKGRAENTKRSLPGLMCGRRSSGKIKRKAPRLRHVPQARGLCVMLPRWLPAAACRESSRPRRTGSWSRFPASTYPHSCRCPPAALLPRCRAAGPASASRPPP